MNKYKATVTCDRQIWDKFKDWATKKGSNASTEIEAFMSQCVIKPDIEERDYLEALIIKNIRQILQSEAYLSSKEPAKTKILKSPVEDRIEKKEVPKSVAKPKVVNLEQSDNDNWRLKQGLNDQELKDFLRLKVSKVTINRWRNGRRRTPDDIACNWEVKGVKWYPKQSLSTVSFDEGFTDKELKAMLKLTQSKSTISRWRRGIGTIPSKVAKHWEVKGTRWYRR